MSVECKKSYIVVLSDVLKVIICQLHKLAGAEPVTDGIFDNLRSSLTFDYDFYFQTAEY